ncbi:Uncharacterised protein [Vibrio cholerae]|nr:Uncharacterised protein [Vibrio cholerae]
MIHNAAGSLAMRPPQNGNRQCAAPHNPLVAARYW